MGLLVGWLLAALLVLGMDGRLPVFLAWVLPGSLVVLGGGSLVRQQLAPSPYNRPSLPERYRVADDLRRPLADVVAAAEQEAITAPAGERWAPIETMPPTSRPPTLTRTSTRTAPDHAA
jgi:hypothetical protein